MSASFKSNALTFPICQIPKNTDVRPDLRHQAKHWSVVLAPDLKQVSIREISSHNKEMLLILLIGFLLPSDSYANKPSSQPSSKHSDIKTEVRREHYLKKLKIELQRSLCTESSLLNCFKISKSECHQTIGSSFGACAKKLNVPEKVPLTGEDILIAESVGGCVSEKLGEKYQSKFLEGSECATRK